jgi:hypothetical protein
MKLIEFIELDNLDQCLTELKHYRTIPAYQRAKELFTDITRSEHHKNMKLFYDFMTLHGFRRLGQGNFGVTYEKPGYPWIFKIFNHDTAYLTWIQFALQHQSNPHVPKIKGKPFKISNTAFVIRMEKLDHNIFGQDDVINLLKRWDGKKLSNYERQYLDDVGIPDMVPILDGIAELIKRYRYLADIHEDNVMNRAGELVIIDPLADAYII